MGVADFITREETKQLIVTTELKLRNRSYGCLARRGQDSMHERCAQVSVHTLSMRSRGWESPPPLQHVIFQCNDTYGGAGIGQLNDLGSGGQRPSQAPPPVHTVESR